jgi:hypothetical protein
MDPAASLELLINPIAAYHRNYAGVPTEKHPLAKPFVSRLSIAASNRLAMALRH